MESKKLLLSVCLITYNHERFITKAIEGVLMQKTNFAWEFIIAEDFSTDNTRRIVQDYALKFPENIKLILQEKNVGAAKNWFDLMDAPQGKYIAYFEGDDYWTDPYKLQKQVDFLENNPEYVISFHDSEVTLDLQKKANNNTLDEYRVRKTFLQEEKKRDLSLYDVINMFNPSTETMVFRYDALPKPLPKEFNSIKNGDFFLTCLLLQSGKAGYINEVMAAYRIHDGGIWANKDNFYQQTAAHNSYYQLSKVLEKKYHKQLEEKINNYFIGIFNTCKQNKDKKAFWQYWKWSIRYNFIERKNFKWLKETITSLF